MVKTCEPMIKRRENTNDHRTRGSSLFSEQHSKSKATPSCPFMLISLPVLRSQKHPWVGMEWLREPRTLLRGV